MSGAGTTMSMIQSLKGNSRLLSRNSMFNKLKKINENNINSRSGNILSTNELVKLRANAKKQIKKDRLIRIIIGVIVVIPTIIVISGILYVIIEKGFSG